MVSIYFDAFFSLNVLVRCWVVPLIISKGPWLHKNHFLGLFQNKVSACITTLTNRFIQNCILDWLLLNSVLSVLWKDIEVAFRIVLHWLNLTLNQSLHPSVFGQLLLHNMLNLAILLNIIVFDSILPIISLRSKLLFTFGLTLQIKIVLI